MKVQILGSGITRFGELWDRSLLSLAQEAGEEALEDAELSSADIDLVLVANMLSSRVASQGHLGAAVAARLGIDSPAVHVESACASGGVAVRMGSTAIAAGEAERVLVVGVEKMTDLSTPEVVSALMEAGDEEKEARVGATFSSLYAMMARAYMAEFGASQEDLAWVAVKNHGHASLNPLAQYPFSVTLEQVLESPVIAEPLKLLDCSPITDGAAAVVLGRAENGKRKTEDRRKVFIAGSGQGQDTLALQDRKDLTALKATVEAAKKAYSMAGIKPSDVRVAEVHDCFSIAEVLALEDLGFCQKGEGFSLVGKEDVRLGGRCPINTSGGLKACGHPVGATGVKQIAEVYRQLKGTAGERQVEKAKVGLAHNVGGSGATVVVHILRSL